MFSKLIPTFCLLLLFNFASFGQNQPVPSIQLKDLVGNMVDADTISNNGKPMVISFWATWCKPCIRELNAINDQYIDWVEETGVKLIAVSIDDSRNTARVKPFIKSQGWEYEVYLDENQEMKRALNVNNIPHTFLVDGEGNIVWQHSGYTPGDEDHLYLLIEMLSNGESIEGVSESAMH